MVLSGSKGEVASLNAKGLWNTRAEQHCNGAQYPAQNIPNTRHIAQRPSNRDGMSERDPLVAWVCDTEVYHIALKIT